MSQVKSLKARRGQVKAQVTRLQTILQNDAISLQEAQIRMKHLEEMWQRFEEIQTQLETRETATEEEAMQNLKEGNEEREKFETNYYKVATQLQGIIEEYMLQQGVAQNPRIGT